MAAQNFKECLRRLLIHEGGYSNHPSDPGGPTNFGITLADYRKYLDPKGTASDVKAMRIEDAKTIYKRRYWDPEHCDELEPGVEACIFDYGVNSGIGRSGKVLRRLVGLPDNTSAVTPEVVAAANRRDPAVLAAAICDERLRFLQALKTWPVFGNGWGRRVAEIKTFALALAHGTVASPHTPDPIPGKGTHPLPPKVGTKVGPAAAVGTGGLAHWLGAHPVETGLIVIAVITALVGLGLYLQRRWQARQEAQTPGTEVVPQRTAAVAVG